MNFKTSSVQFDISYLQRPPVLHIRPELSNVALNQRIFESAVAATDGVARFATDSKISVLCIAAGAAYAIILVTAAVSAIIPIAARIF